MNRTLVCLAALMCLNLSAEAAHHAPMPAQGIDAKTTTQLPRGAWPTHYDVSITPDAQALTFQGKVAIAVSVATPRSSLTLQAADMQFSSAELWNAAGDKLIGTAKVSTDNAKQTATFAFEKSIAKGKYQLKLSYSGKIGTQANGLFALDYDSAQGKQRALYTQFENSDARRMIPSWDEPGFKATFGLSVTVPAAQMAVANMPQVDRKEDGKGMATIRFATSPRMSTYLLYFSVGDFERATLQAGKTEIGVVTKRGSIDQAKYVMEQSKNVLEEYNDYFGVPFPLPKLDNVAAPGSSQFFGAMENWGAIFSFEGVILQDPSYSTQADKQGAFTVAAHEIAHQWFGNLVTMTWWDDLWLNEGFASWMESRTTQRLHPEWKAELRSIGGRNFAMSQDALKTTHPIVTHIATVEQASQAFDGITYQKGQAVIGMLESFVGADVWRQGVRSYMQKHQYGNTVSDDLWKEVELAAKQPIRAMAHDFTLQPGIPLIQVAAPVCKDGHASIALTQAEFTNDRPDKKPLNWRVPVMARNIDSSASVRTVVSGGNGSLQLANCSPVIVNAGQSGYYRTQYTPAHFRSIAGQFGNLAAIDQIGLLTDTMALAGVGLQSAGDVLDLALATPLSAEPQVWDEVAGNLEAFYHRFDETDPNQATYAKFAIARLSPKLAQLGWAAQPDESDASAILRSNLIRHLSVLGDPAVVAEARRRYAARSTDPSAMPAALRRTVMSVVARHADAATWDEMHAFALSEKTPFVKDQLYRLLASSTDKALAQRAMDLALSPEVRETNRATLIGAVAENHPDMAFDFAMTHFAEISKSVDTTSAARYYPRLAGNSASMETAAKVKAFALAHLPEESRRSAMAAISQIEFRIARNQRTVPTLNAWLALHKS